MHAQIKRPIFAKLMIQLLANKAMQETIASCLRECDLISPLSLSLSLYLRLRDNFSHYGRNQTGGLRKIRRVMIIFRRHGRKREKGTPNVIKKK